MEKFDDRKGTEEHHTGMSFEQPDDMAYKRRLSVVPMSAAKAAQEAQRARSLAAATSGPEVVKDLNHGNII